MAIFGSKPAVERVPTDKVYPLHFMESSLLVQGSNMAVPLVFEAVLDPETLRRALEDLVKLDGWHRLGGRLRKNTAGEIEWHIPAEFTSSRPAISYDHTDHGTPIAAHPAASQIPKPSNAHPAVVGDPALLTDLAWGAGTKLNGIVDYLHVDRPVLGLHTHAFTDATIAVLTWQHVAFDALGLKYVVEGWCDVLWGRMGEIVKPWPIERDPFESIKTGERHAAEEHVLVDRRVGLCGLLRWGLGYGFDMLARAKETRMVCVPEAHWRPQLEESLRELREQAVARGEDPGKVFLTENDVVTAFFIRTVVKAEGWSPTRTVAASIAMSLRKAFEKEGLIPPASEMPIVGNAFGWSNVLLTAGEVTTKPLSFVAAQIRRAINEQGTRAQHEAYYTMVRTSGKGLPIIVFGDGGMAQLGFSNWAKAGLFDLDFSPARKGGSGPCRPVYAQVNNGPIHPGDGFFVLGKDNHGNYWAQGDKVKGQWDRFAKILDEDFK